MKNKIIVLLSVFIFCMTLGIKGAMAAAATDVACKAPCINSFEIQDGQVTSTDIADGAVTNTKITDGAVTNTKIQDGAVTDAKITGPISSSKIQKPANVIVVAKAGGDYTTITDALNAINPSATNPYVIDVMPGTYTENITMKSYVHLRGAGRDVTTIEASSDAVITINSLTDVEISGFTIKGGYRGIYVNNSSPTITANKIANSTTYGIYNWYASPKIIDNIITGTGEGIENNYSPAFISGNVIADNRWDGIWNASSSPTITGNTITGNSKGDNTNGNGGIGNDNASAPVITGNNISENSDGISEWGGDSATIIGNVITGNTRYGIYSTTSASLLKIMHNRITGNISADISVERGTPNISFNVYDTISGTAAGAYNVKSNGTPW